MASRNSGRALFASIARREGSTMLFADVFVGGVLCTLSAWVIGLPSLWLGLEPGRKFELPLGLLFWYTKLMNKSTLSRTRKKDRPTFHGRRVCAFAGFAGSVRGYRCMDFKTERARPHPPRSHPPAGRARAEGEVEIETCPMLNGCGKPFRSVKNAQRPQSRFGGAMT